MTKSAWETPQIIAYGDVADITASPICKLKTPGSGDDAILMNDHWVNPPTFYICS